MKNILILLFSFLSMTVFATPNGVANFSDVLEYVDSTKYGVEFDTRLIELGKIKKGEKVSGSFILTNTGTEDIVIEFASSCECTTVSHSYSPIKPGTSTNIDFIFDSSKKEKSGTTDLDLYLKNLDPKTGEPIFEILQYSYELVQ